MATPTCTISATGISRPTLETILAWVVDQFHAIYGADVSLDSSTQDGEWLGLLASAIDDTNAMAVQAYNAFSPSTAQGTGLSSVIKINGLARLIPSFSTAPMLIVGQAGKTISNGLVADDAGHTWALPASVVIPYSGQIVVTATCTELGAIAAPQGTISQIANSQPGWQTASNTAPATVGLPVEPDPTVRIRQAQSTMNSSTALAQGLEGALLALPGVARCRVYENEEDATDANGIPSHCVSVVIDGGNVATIAALIKAKKGGCSTYGSTLITVTDAWGIPSRVAFFIVHKPVITVAISIKQLVSFTDDTVGKMKTSVADWGNSLGIGESIQWNRLYGAAYLFGAAEGRTFEITSLAVARDGATPTQGDVPIIFREAALFSTANISVTVVV